MLRYSLSRRSFLKTSAMAGAAALINNPPTITMLSFSALSPAIFGESAVTDKIDMKLLYAGHPGSDREQDFARFLKLRFVEVRTCDLATISEEVAGSADVVILDYDQTKHPRPRFSNDYGVPTVTMGVAGAHIGSTNRLKTGYL